MIKRTAKIVRNTKETQITLKLDIDGKGSAKVSTGLPFLDHMLILFTKHGLFNLEIKAKGDLEVDAHHTVEDIGICLGQAFDKSLGNKKGITRYASINLPMDESLCRVVIDIGGRPYFSYKVKTPRQKIGNFETDTVKEFFEAFVNNAKINLHLDLIKGTNTHHIIEAVFKGFAVALDKATIIDKRKKDIPSTKGVL